MPMTKAEAICACNNILGLVEDLDELLTEKGREDYAKSINTKFTDMRKYIRESWRGDRITDKMDAAIRNSWAGLRKWDHEDAYNTELFEGLNDVMQELQAQATDGPAAATSEEGEEEPRDARTSTKKQKGREMTDDAMPSVPADAAPPTRTLPTRPRTPSSPAATSAGAKASEMKAPALSSNGSGLIDRELVAKAREKALGIVRRQVEEKQVRVVDIQTIVNGDLAAILNMTSSDRTTQMIVAAFYAGKMTGIQALAQDLIE